MSDLTRREFSKKTGAAGVAVVGSFGLFAPAIAQGNARVVIVGGGAGGATVARRLKVAAPNLEVTLIEVSPKYASPFLSEHYIGGFRSLESLMHSYEGLGALGITVVNDWVSGVHTARKQVTLKGGNTLSYDRLVLAPGVDVRYETIERYTPEVAQKIPHAWKGGAQNAVLRQQLLDMPDGGTVVMSVPPGALRGQTAAYARASMVAHYLKFHKPQSRLILLDGNRDFPQRSAFEEGWKTHYADVLEHRLSTSPNEFKVVRIDPNTREVETAGGAKFTGAVVSLVPEQRAGVIAHAAGCADGDWCPVAPATFESTRVPGVHVLGDAADAGMMPKTAFAANSQGAAVANHIAADLAGKKRFPARFRSTKWSLIATNNAIKMGASYVVSKDGVVPVSSFVSEPKEPAAIRAKNFKESLAWYEAMTKDMFGTA
ncbi:MAG: FCSD flavin-binding domain-containing protein [Hyphomicrobiaceae bacterium]